MKVLVKFDEETGIYEDGLLFLVLGRAKSKTFKTLVGAKKWASKIGLC